MTNEEIKSLIRKSQGWTELKEGPHQYGWRRGDEWHYLHNVPNYPESLDACAEFEKTLTEAEWDAYSAEIVSLTLWDRATDTVKRILQTTARQRCLAYLKTKGILP